jgi:hypothetical protein
MNRTDHDHGQEEAVNQQANEELVDVVIKKWNFEEFHESRPLFLKTHRTGPGALAERPDSTFILRPSRYQSVGIQKILAMQRRLWVTSQGNLPPLAQSCLNDR